MEKGPSKGTIGATISSSHTPNHSWFAQQLHTAQLHFWTQIHFALLIFHTSCWPVPVWYSLRVNSVTVFLFLLNIKFGYFLTVKI